MKAFLVLMLVALTSIVWEFVTGGAKKYRVRKCQGRQWKGAFPHSNRNQIRKFLLIFADAFIIAPKQKLVFAPTDKLLDVYKKTLPHNI